MKHILVLAFVCVACFATLGCGDSGPTAELMPEPTAEEEARIMEEEMAQEAEMEDPANR